MKRLRGAYQLEARAPAIPTASGEEGAKKSKDDKKGKDKKAPKEKKVCACVCTCVLFLILYSLHVAIEV